LGKLPILPKKNPLHFYCFNSGLEIRFQIRDLLHRSSSPSMACFRRADAVNSIFLDVHEFSHSLFKDTHDLKDASITDAHELADTGRGGMTWRPAVLLAVHPPAAPVLLSLFSPASAAPSPSAAEEEVPHRVWALPHHRARGLVARPEEAAPGLAVAARFPASPLRQLRPAPTSSPIRRRAGRHSTGAPSR
jgi:hypothetical protein